MMEKSEMERDKRIDIAKALGIILVVLGHAGFPYSSIIFRFHMALFFILSGWCFSDKYLQSWETFRIYIWKKIKGLYIPFILFNGITLLLRNLLIQINIYSDNEAFLMASEFGGGNGYGITTPLALSEMKPWIINVLKFSGESQLGGATWFLRVLFGLTVVWGSINFIVKYIAKFSDKQRMYINIVLSVFFLVVAFEWMREETHFTTQFETVAATYGIYTVGYYLKNYYKKLETVQEVCVAGLSFVILYYCDFICNQNGWNSNVNEFANPLMYIVTQMSGLVFTLSVASLVSRVKICNLFVYIGQHTLSILFFHFLSFKVITIVQCIFYHEPAYRIAAFPVFNSSGLWWLAYTLCGISIPLYLAWLYQKGKDMLFKNLQKGR